MISQELDAYLHIALDHFQATLHEESTHVTGATPTDARSSFTSVTMVLMAGCLHKDAAALACIRDLLLFKSEASVDV